MNDRDRELWTRADQLLDRALDVPPDERPRLLDEACDGQPELRRLVDRLLGHLEHSATHLDSEGRIATAGALDPAAGLVDVARSPLAPGSRVGAYRVIEEIGRGGMSVVYLAERDTGDFTQRVAVKVIQNDLSSVDAEARFARERQILADARHPDIARLLDGGSTADGLHYLVMELVEGVPIDVYCRQRRLTVEARVNLFLRVARAVGSAHRMLIVHRDIKPSNVLVTDDGNVKLLDFGIAKLLDASADVSDLTGTGLMPMTPAYASPEQIRGGTITTSTDVYQLGALLYTLLTGRSPHGVHGSDVLAAARAVVEDEPPRLWDAIRQTPASEAERSSQFSTAPATLRSQLRGDLEAVVMKALRKDPDDRYGSVDGLVGDLERVLAGRPVSARPLTARYRAALFVRRHRWPVAAAVAALLLLVGWAATSTVQNRRIAREVERANREARTAERVSGFLVDLFAEADPARTLGEELSVRTVLEEGRERLATELGDEPVVRARLLSAIAAVSSNLGLDSDADELLTEALQIQRHELGEDHEQTLHTKLTLGAVRSTLGRYDEARTLLEEAVSGCRHTFGPDHPHTLGAINNLAILEQRLGEHQAARQRLHEVLEARRRTLGPEHVQTLGAMVNLGIAHLRTGNPERGLELVGEARSIGREALGDTHPWVLEATTNEGILLRRLGRPDESRELLEQASEGMHAVLGADHPSTITTDRNLAWAYLSIGRTRDAAELFRSAADALERTLGPDHPDTLECRRERADARQLAGDLDGARRDYLDVVAVQRETIGPSSSEVQATLYNLACLEVRAGRHRVALDVLSEAVEAGFDDAGMLEDPDLEPLHGELAFQRLADIVRARANLETDVRP